VEKTGIDCHLPIGSSNAPTKPPTNLSAPSKPLVGGWYPIFFDQYSPEKIQALIANINSGKVASLEIQYDQNLPLANKLAQQITTETRLQVSLAQSSPPDSPGVTYERNRVTIIVRSK
jgi:endonuclease G